MKDMERCCKYYMCERDCSKGREGTFRIQCQICSKYDPVPVGQPARKEKRKKKRDKYHKDKRNWS